MAICPTASGSDVCTAGWWGWLPPPDEPACLYSEVQERDAEAGGRPLQPNGTEAIHACVSAALCAHRGQIGDPLM